MEAEIRCFLCVAARSSSAKPWTDRVLRYDSGVGFIIAGVGAQRVGYCLLAPTEHVASICALTSTCLRKFKSFVATQLNTLTAWYGSLTYWEHGGIRAGKLTSACVDHAHLHILPGVVPLHIEPEGLVHYGDISEWWSDARRWRDHPYVAFGHSSTFCIVGPDPGVPQYFRRQVADFIGRPDEWDYAACPNYTIAKRTIDDIMRRSS